MNKLILCLAVGAVLGCSKGSPQPVGLPPEPGERPQSIPVQGGEVVVGFERGAIRERKTVSSFAISKHPVRVKEYRACVAKGVCHSPSGADECRGQEPTSVLDGPTFDIVGADELPITCASFEEAQVFCTWVGGRLPTLPEWLSAVRGPDVRTYPWGHELPTCEHHPWARGLVASQVSCCLGRDNCGIESLGRVGAHAKGAGPNALEDALLSPGELLAASSNSVLGACVGDSGGCVVRGRHGAIESVEALRTKSDIHVAPVTAAFRCVWEVSQ